MTSRARPEISRRRPNMAPCCHIVIIGAIFSIGALVVYLDRFHVGGVVATGGLFTVGVGVGRVYDYIAEIRGSIQI